MITFCEDNILPCLLLAKFPLEMQGKTLLVPIGRREIQADRLVQAGRQVSNYKQTNRLVQGGRQVSTCRQTGNSSRQEVEQVQRDRQAKIRPTAR